MNILFVCLGNICRSPMAAGIMSSIYEKEQINGIIESAGTHDWNLGKPADARSVKVAAESGIDITEHRARQICKEDFAKFDVIYAMDRDNERALRSMAPPSVHSKIKRIRNAPDNHHECDVPDPYGGDEAGFHQVFDVLHTRCRELARDIARERACK